MGGPLRQKIEGEGAVRRVAAPAAVSFRGRARPAVRRAAAPVRLAARRAGSPFGGVKYARPSGYMPRRKGGAEVARGNKKGGARPNGRAP